MFYNQAEKIVLEYIALFTDTSITSKVARNYIVLPYPKETIVNAYKVYMAFVGIFRNKKQDDISFMFELLNKLNSFVSKNEADHINLLHSRISVKKKLFIKKPEVSVVELEQFSDFITSSNFAIEHDEVIEILNETQKFVYDWVVNKNGQLDCHEMYEHIFNNILHMEYEESIGIDFYEKGIKVFNNSIK